MAGMPSGEMCVEGDSLRARSIQSQQRPNDVPPAVSNLMQDPSYYREQAERAQRLARSQTNREVEGLLLRMAQDYEDLAEDLENGAIEIRHPELLPQHNRP